MGSESDVRKGKTFNVKTDLRFRTDAGLPPPAPTAALTKQRPPHTKPADNPQLFKTRRQDHENAVLAGEGQYGLWRALLRQRRGGGGRYAARFVSRLLDSKI